MKKRKKKTILLLLMCVVIILIGTGYIPVKYAVYADKDTINAYYNGKLTSEEQKKYFGHTIENWLDKGGKYNSARIVETIMLNGRLKLKRSGIQYIGDVDHSAPLLYFEIQNKSPFNRLNSSFDPSKVKNYYVIKYYALNGDDPAEWKAGYYEKEIVITDWVPVYPIQRSGWLASKLLPKSYLTIWDYIG